MFGSLTRVAYFAETAMDSAGSIRVPMTPPRKLLGFWGLQRGLLSTNVILLPCPVFAVHDAGPLSGALRQECSGNIKLKPR